MANWNVIVMNKEIKYMHMFRHTLIPLWMHGTYKYYFEGFQINNLVISLCKGVPTFVHPKNEYNLSHHLPYKTLQELLCLI